MRTNVIQHMLVSIRDLKVLINNMICPGKVVAVDYEKKRVQVNTGRTDTPFAKWITNSGGNNIEWNPPKVGDVVMVLNPSGDYGQAVVLPFLIPSSEETPTNGDTYQKKFANGSSMAVNTDTDTMQFTSSDGVTNISLDGEGNIVIDGSNSVEVKKGSNSVKVSSTKADVDGLIVNINGSTAVNITAPTINLDGSVSITGSATLNGQSVATN